MIYLYSGTPGSGKSFHVCKDILFKLKVKNEHVVSNMHINTQFIKNKKAVDHFYYIDNDKLTPEILILFSQKYLKHGKENQCLLVIDECAIKFNCRDFDRKDRSQWITFFQQHRKLGYNVILVSQNDRLIDRQIRAFIEYEVKHRQVRNYKAFGFILALLCGGSLFCAVTYWYGMKERISAEWIPYRRSVSKMYDTYFMYEEETKKMKGIKE